MDDRKAIALANLLSVLLPLGIQTYTQIQQAHADELRPVEDVLAKADQNWSDVVSTAKAELQKL